MNGSRTTQGQDAAGGGGATALWLGFQILTVMLRVVAVVGLALGMFLCVFLGYITLPLIAPALLGAGYLGVRIGRRALRSR
jgi:hypothetical protein